MRRSWSSVAGRTASVCALAALTLLSSTAVAQERPQAVVIEPENTANASSIVVMLHGMCDLPERECPYFSAAATRGDWLVCPRAPIGCGGGGTKWQVATAAAAIESALAAAPIEQNASVPRTLIGFSQGAFAALHVAHTSRDTWDNLVLMGASVNASPAMLKRAGVKNVVFASGDRDNARWHMVEQSRMLSRHGVRSTFIGLGPVGHWFSPEMDPWMTEVNAWLEAGEAPEPESVPQV